jgi:transcriptional regulator with XRE-family HTH domain
MPTNQLGSKIRQLRESRNMSLSDLSQESGISRGYLHQLEKGENSPTQEKLIAIANALGVLVAELLGEIDGYEDLSNIPDSLKQFARENELTSADVVMLSKINYRGRQPETIIEWGILYSVIKGTLGKR